MTENEAKKTLEIFDKERKEYMDNIPSILYFDRVKAENFTQSLKMAIKALEEIQQYRAIGTVGECLEARGKQTGKKVNNRTPLRDLNGNLYTVRGDCSNCGNIGLLLNTDYCNICGQKLDWSE